MVYKWLKNNLSGCAAGSCLLCGVSIRAIDGLCIACEAALPRLAPDQLPPAGIDALYAACSYDWPVDQLIAGFKYRAGISAGQVLSRRLSRLLEQHVGLAAVDYLLPVPLHPARYRSRGFNQAVEIARVLQRGSGIARIAARRLSDDQPQAGKTAAQRRASRIRFQLNHDLTGRAVAIIDDVVTTGTTVQALAKQCRRAGAVRVEAWCLARAS